MRKPLSGLLMPTLALAIAAPVGAQTPAPSTANDPAPLLLIHREELKPGHSAAHAASETAWAGAFAKAGVPVYWLGMTTIVGPSEAWFLERHESLASVERSEAVVDGNASLRAESDGFEAGEAEMVLRVSKVIARYRPGMSYQAGISLADKRFMAVDLVRVKPGYVAEFAENWREIVEAHTKAGLAEHWAVYQIDSGMADGTFLFFYPHASLAEADAAGPAHAANAYRDAVGERGRLKSRDVQQTAVEMSARYYFRLSPGMSTLPKTWSDADPFWNRPAPVVAPPARNERRR